MKNKAVLVDVLSVQETGIENHFQYGSDNDVRRAEGSSAGTGRRTDLHLEVSCSDARPQIQIQRDIQAKQTDTAVTSTSLCTPVPVSWACVTVCLLLLCSLRSNHGRFTLD